MLEGTEVFVSCDYSATGVWLDGVCVEPDEHLGLSEETCETLEKWQCLNDIILVYVDEFDGENTEDEYCKSWELAGEKWDRLHRDDYNRLGGICLMMVRKELGDKFTVVGEKTLWSEEKILSDH